MSEHVVQPPFRSWTIPKTNVLLKNDDKPVNIRITDLGKGKKFDDGTVFLMLT
jgi:hypothetical protein